MSRLVVMAGLPGVGKSTVARLLAARIGALWLRIDAIETAMRASHMEVEDLADGGYAAAQAAAQAALEQGFDIVADSVNPIALTRDAWRRPSARAGASHVDVELFCSDVKIHRARVETRRADIPGHALPDWAAVCTRLYHPFVEADLRLDTAHQTVEKTVLDILRHLEDLQ